MELKLIMFAIITIFSVALAYFLVYYIFTKIKSKNKDYSTNNKEYSVECKWYTLHNWVIITEQSKENFLNQTITETVNTNFRICTKCSKVQKYIIDSTGGYHIDLSQTKSKIVRDKLFYTYSLKV